MVGETKLKFGWHDIIANPKDLPDLGDGSILLLLQDDIGVINMMRTWAFYNTNEKFAEISKFDWCEEHIVAWSYVEEFENDYFNILN